MRELKLERLALRERLDTLYAEWESLSAQIEALADLDDG
jgi:hypothetical protein